MRCEDLERPLAQEDSLAPAILSASTTTILEELADVMTTDTTDTTPAPDPTPDPPVDWGGGESGGGGFSGDF